MSGYRVTIGGRDWFLEMGQLQVMNVADETRVRHLADLGYGSYILEAQVNGLWQWVDEQPDEVSATIPELTPEQSYILGEVN